MEAINSLLRPEILSLLIPIVVIVAVFANKALKAHHKHTERMEKIRNGIDPDSAKGN